MSDMDIRVEGLSELIKKLNSVSNKTYMRATMRAAVEHLKGKVKKYPPGSAANSPSSVPGSHWYIRGTGGFYKRKRDGGISSYKNSKNLQGKWTTQIDADGMRAQVGNNVSYAPYVQDEREQMPYHKARGWVTVQDVAKDEANVIAKLFVKNIEKALSK